MLSFVVQSVIALVVLGLALPAISACSSPTYPAGSTSIWVPDEGCSRGSTYNTNPTPPPQRHCHCWSKCGYTCDIIASKILTLTTTTTTTVPPRICATPSVTTGQTWVPNPNCPDGSTYNTATQHCHCYAHCGYKCDPLPTTTTTTTTTSSPRICGTPSVTPGQTWVPNPNCPDGSTYNTATQHCHCYAYCGYKCDPLPTTTTTTTTTSSPRICRTPSVTPNQTWVPNPNCPDGTTYNTATRHCHCYAFCGYKCDLLSTT